MPQGTAPTKPIESEHSPDEFFALTGLSREKYNLVEAKPDDISASAKSQPIPREIINQIPELLTGTKRPKSYVTKSPVKVSKPKKKRIKPVQINNEAQKPSIVRVAFFAIF